MNRSLNKCQLGLGNGPVEISLRNILMDDIHFPSLPLVGLSSKFTGFVLSCQLVPRPHANHLDPMVQSHPLGSFLVKGVHGNSCFQTSLSNSSTIHYQVNKWIWSRARSPHLGNQPARIFGNRQKSKPLQPEQMGVSRHPMIRPNVKLKPVKSRLDQAKPKPNLNRTNANPNETKPNRVQTNQTNQPSQTKKHRSHPDPNRFKPPEPKPSPNHSHPKQIQKPTPQANHQQPSPQTKTPNKPPTKKNQHSKPPSKSSTTQAPPKATTRPDFSPGSPPTRPPTSRWSLSSSRLPRVRPPGLREALQQHRVLGAWPRVGSMGQRSRSPARFWGGRVEGRGGSEFGGVGVWGAGLGH